MEQFENSPIKAHLHGQQEQWLSGLEVKLQLGISQGFYFAKYFHGYVQWKSEEDFDKFLSHSETAPVVCSTLDMSEVSYRIGIVFYEGDYFVYLRKIAQGGYITNYTLSTRTYEEALGWLNEMIFNQGED